MPKKNKRQGQDGEKSNRRKQAEEQYWAVQTAKFRVKNPEAFKQIRKKEQVAKYLLKPLKQLRESKRQSIENWQAIENYLLSGKATPERLLKMFTNAQKNAENALKIKENFLKKRAVATEMVFSQNDWNAIRRILAMKDTKAVMNSEKMFFGRMFDLSKAGKLAQFSVLLTRLKVSNDKTYAIHKQRIALAGMGIGKQIVRTNSRIKELAEIYAARKMNAVEYLEQSLLAEYALTYQYFEFTKSGEELYTYLEKQTKDKGLKNILNRIASEMNQRKLYYRSERGKIEHKFYGKNSKL